MIQTVNLRKLMTKEDPQHAHKLLGTWALVSFAHRLSQIGDADMGFIHASDTSTAITLSMHFLLSISSLIFHVPPKRLPGEWRIWREYRLHSIIFACRYIVLMALMRWNLISHGACLLVVLCTCACADLATWSVGKENRSNTIRGVSAPSIVRTLMCVAQFHGTFYCLACATQTRYSPHFGSLFVIQCNAFLMTLRRKQVASHTAMITLYGCMILWGFLVLGRMEMWVHGQGVRDICYFIGTGNLAALFRMMGHVNKYVLWTCLGLLVPWLEQQFVDGTSIGEVAYFVATGTGILMMAYLKDRKEKRKAIKCVD
uniref:Uncharacterized protein n=1 Tax=Grammatophora oceanica TaxID=210454 RepID=A0A7S1URJ9_9STRA|mmetsp:Transcript_18727/g.27745  ORF Transcript_18727/g.27745 Transcript_18727/m.27745 type:complete len:314 (+) Transcript_18727:140-1081(+)